MKKSAKDEGSMRSTATTRSRGQRGTASRWRATRALPALMLVSALVGCVAGPRFQRPMAPVVARYTTDSSAAQTPSSLGAPGASPRVTEGAAVERQWWRALGAPALDSLIAQSLLANPTLASAEATLRQSQEVFSAVAGTTRFPVADATMGAQQQRMNPSALGQTGTPREFALLNASVGVRYRLDLAGANRRTLEALAARADYRRFQLAGVRLALTANLANAAITQSSLAALVTAMDASLRDDEEQLALMRERVRLGAASPDDVLSRELLVGQRRADVLLQRKQLQQSEHLLAVLAGRAPGAGGMPTFALDAFVLPSDVPVVVPSELVRRRPDILAAEALLHAANAEYGVAVAELYPQINLSAALGTQALSAGALFGSGSAVWQLLGQLTQPLLNPGLPAEKRAALAAFDAAAANYQSVVLEALRTVADVLRALDTDAQTFAALSVADTAAQGALESARRQYTLGAASWVQVLTARQQAQQVRSRRDAARAQRLLDTVALYQALGG